MTPAEFGQSLTGAMGLLLLGLAGYGIASLRFRVPGTATFVALAVAAAVWCFGYAFEKAQTTVEDFFLGARIEYLGLAFLPSLWLLVTLSWMEHPWAKSWALRLGVLGLSAGVVALVWTNDWHHWWYSNIVPTGTRGFARFHPGPAYFPLFGILASSFVLSSVLIVRRHQGRWKGEKAAVIVTANIFPVVFGIAFQAGLRPWGLDPTILSLIPAFAVLTAGLFRHDFIRVVPIARETVVESLEDPVLVHNARGRLVDHNAAARVWLEQIVAALATTTETRGEWTLVGPQGSRHFHFRRTPVVGPGSSHQGTVTILSDVTEEKRLLDELVHEASHDALTGISNRRHFEDHALGEITRADRQGGTLALVLFDLDRFKAINDAFGHQGGDQALKAVVDVISPRLRGYDLFARVGGEEFAVLMPGVSPVEAREVAERWRVCLEESPLALPEARVTLTASFGVACLNDLPLNLPPDPRTRLDALMVLADQALYRAKREGRNRVC